MDNGDTLMDLAVETMIKRQDDFIKKGAEGLREEKCSDKLRRVNNVNDVF